MSLWVFPVIQLSTSHPGYCDLHGRLIFPTDICVPRMASIFMCVNPFAVMRAMTVHLSVFVCACGLRSSEYPQPKTCSRQPSPSSTNARYGVFLRIMFNSPNESVFCASDSQTKPPIER
ncbi:hypothetical protein ATANTOWER_018276 [Ataeniobius toweri]|uniref:Uncharacterized protein n=1 Tax=Ataeniobius toweri TaxID=208326 RepID=A0ABU7C106_9TELE|nr:hypothetical protein [Ataeniobius toweri]